MAQNGEIIIKIVQGNEPSPDKPDKPVQVQKEKTDDKLENAIFTSLLQKTARELKGIVIDEANYQINKYFRMNDNYLAQQQKDIALGIIGKVTSVGTSLVGGFMFGGIPGLVAETIIQGVKLGIDINRNYTEERIRLNQMDANLDYSRQRAGYSLTAGSQGENR